MSRFDQLYRQLIVTGFFKRGWGDPGHIEDLLRLRLTLGDPNSLGARGIVDDLLKHVKVEIDKETKKDDKGVVFVDASFVSPLHSILPHVMPVESRVAKFQLMYDEGTSTLLPEPPPVALHLAGTGDHYFYRRRALQGSRLLSAHGVSSAFLENPFYGYRKPKDQLRSSVHYVNDIFVMGAALVLESWVILNWLRDNKFGSNFCLTGVSMGGFMASLAAGFWRQSPVALVPCLSWSSAAPVFTQGVLSDALPWKNLTAQFLDNPVFGELQRGISRGEYGAKYINGGFFPGRAISNNQTPSVRAAAAVCNVLSSKKPSPEETLRLNVPDLLPVGAGAVGVGESSSSTISANTSTPQQPSRREFSTSPLGSSWRKKADETKTSDRGGGGGGGDYVVAKTFMNNLLDQFTHLGNYSTPLDPNLTQFLVATNDAYVPSHANQRFVRRKSRRTNDDDDDKTAEFALPDASDDMRTVWPGCSTVELKDYGHVGAYLFKQREYSRVIKSNIDKLQSIYHSS